MYDHQGMPLLCALESQGGLVALRNSYILLGQDKVDRSRSPSIPPSAFPISTALNSVCSVRTYAMGNLILEPHRFALILLFFV